MSRWIVICSLLVFVGQGVYAFDIKRLRTYFVRSPLYQKLDLDLWLAKNDLAQSLSLLDSELGGVAQNKEYPLSSAKFFKMALQKRFVTDMTIFGGYRYAKGVQEYSNIKTGARGEYLVGLKLPLLSLIARLSRTLAQIQKAKLSVVREKVELHRLRLELWQRVQEAYYTLALAKMKERFIYAMVEKAKSLQTIVQQKVERGVLAKIALDEIALMVASRQRAWEESRLEVKQANNLLNFLLGSRIDPSQIPKLPPFDRKFLSKQQALALALGRSLELRKIEVAQRVNDIKKRSLMLWRGQADLALYGVYDPIYKEGYKASFTLSIALTQRAFKAKRERVKIENLKLSYQRKIEKESIVRSVEDLYAQIKSQKRIRTLLQKRVGMSERLFFAQKKRFESGVGSLFLLNERELALLQNRLDLLQSRYRLWILFCRYQKLLVEGL